MSALVGTCHCGRVRITVPRKPNHVTHCNCTLCSKTGFQGIYYAPDELVIEGEVDCYVRADSNPAYIAQQRCRHCGIATHWVPLTDPRVVSISRTCSSVGVRSNFRTAGFI